MMIEGERRFAEEGVTVWLAGLNPDVRDYIRSSGFADQLGEDRLFANARAAIRNYLDSS
jgi:sulfate permease, SulP family